MSSVLLFTLASLALSRSYRSDWAGGSASLLRSCDQVVVATETPQFIVPVWDVRERAEAQSLAREWDAAHPREP
jgi:hypothetical protein